MSSFGAPPKPRTRPVEELATELKGKVLKALEGKLTSYSSHLFDASDMNSFKAGCGEHGIRAADPEKTYGILDQKNGGKLGGEKDKKYFALKIGDTLKVYAHSMGPFPEMLVERIGALQAKDPKKDWKAVLQFAKSLRYEPEIMNALKTFIDGAAAAGVPANQLR